MAAAGVQQAGVAVFLHRGRRFSLGGYSVSDHLFRAVAARGGFYEGDLLEYIRFVTAGERVSGSVAVDVGANIGNHSVYFGAFVSDLVLAVEPNPEVLSVLRTNLASNVDNVILYECAVGEADAFGRVVMPDTAVENIGMARIAVSDATADAVPVRTVDGLLADLRRGRPAAGRVLLMKIDVEGMELAVLRGARDTLARDWPHLFVEARSPVELDALRSYLGGLGYVVLSRWATTPVYHFAWQPRLALRLRAAAYTWPRQLRGRVDRALRVLLRRTP